MSKDTLYYLSGILLFFVLWNTSIGVCQESTGKFEEINIENKQNSNPLSDSLENAKIINHKVIAYYFHGTKRCPTCRKIESYSKEAVEALFTEGPKNGKLEWKSINTDRSENKHYKKEYRLFSSALVISDERDGKQSEWKNLEKIWQLVGDKDRFIKYIQDEIHTFLGED